MKVISSAGMGQGASLKLTQVKPAAKAASQVLSTAKDFLPPSTRSSVEVLCFIVEITDKYFDA